jgi:lysophospholipase L1-like esterase
MSGHKCVFASLLFIGLAWSLACEAQAPKKSHWIGTWATAPMLAEDGFRVHPFSGVTLREIAHISVGGDRVRIRFTNEFGSEPLTISDAHVAMSGGGSGIQAGTDHALTFGGSSSVKVPPGAVLLSDPVQMAVPPLADVAVSFYLPAQVMRAETFHDFADQDNYVVNGDVAATPTLTEATTLASWYFLDGIEVPADEDSRAIVTLGDSITDGAHSTPNANRRWPDVLAARLQQDKHLAKASILNEGIGGNRVVNDGYGPNALARLDRDVLSQNGVRYLIVLESINDIGRLAKLQTPDDEITTQQLEQALQQIADAAHEHGIKVYGATLTPYGGAGYYSEKGEQVREDINRWIRESGTFDAVIDFDKITQNAQDPMHFDPKCDSGDHLHPGDDGYKAMGDSIDLNLFAK